MCVRFTYVQFDHFMPIQSQFKGQDCNVISMRSTMKTSVDSLPMYPGEI